MIRIDRRILATTGFIYAMLHAALGILWVAEYENSQPAIWAIVLYVALVISTMLFYRGVRLPLAQAIITVALGLLVPLLAQTHQAPELFNDYSTWYVLGLGTLFAALAIRGHIPLAIAGLMLEIFVVLTWAGWFNFFAVGLLGATIIVAGACVVRVGIERATREADRFAVLNAAAAADAAALKAAGEQRAEFLRMTLDRARPMLERIASAEPLTPTERSSALLLEAGLRDEIRGKDLLSEVTRASIERARRRGVTVAVLDEGGIANLDTTKAEILHQEIANLLDTVEAGKVTIRAPRDEAWLVTIAAFVESSSAPVLWRRISEDELAR